MISGLFSPLCLFKIKKKKFDRKHNKELGDLALLKTRIRVFCVSLMFSIAGIPPMIGFLAKAGIFISGWYFFYLL
jgi:NADH:ubiquinone oxidoreductase subunit 2 (subunit N)